MTTAATKWSRKPVSPARDSITVTVSILALLEIVGYESAAVGGDLADVFPDADTGRFAADDPGADYRIVAVETGELDVPLVDMPLFAVGASGADPFPPAADQDIPPLARQKRFPDVIPGQRPVARARLQQVGVFRKHLPEDRQDSLVAQQHLPGRFDHPEPGLGQVGAELFPHQPFPGVELEQMTDRFIVKVDKPFGSLVPADLVDEEQPGLQPSLDGRVPQVFQVSQVFGAVGGTGKMEQPFRSAGPLFPGGDQLLVNRVELVGLRETVLEPEPLHYARLQDGGRGIGVVLQEVGGRGAVIGKVEPAVERGIVTVPGGDDMRYETFRYFQPMGKPGADVLFGGLHAEALQLRGFLVQSVDFGGSETVTGRLVPVGLTVDGMVGHAVLLDQLFPPRAWCQIKTLHVHLREKRGSSQWSRSRR